MARERQAQRALDMRMRESGGHGDLALEALAFAGEARGFDEIEGDLAPMLGVFREVHGGHAAASQLALDAIAIGQLQACTSGCHGGDRDVEHRILAQLPRVASPESGRRGR